MSTQHTPGPWEYKPSMRCVIGGPDRVGIVDINPDQWPREESEANAHLIAACPELYDALRAAIKATIIYWESQDKLAVERAPWINNARAAIAKAEGR